MLLSETSIQEFLILLASKKPTPGGGAAAALVGSIGVALGSMVANFTVGKEKFKDKEPLMNEILKENEELMNNLIKLIDKDAEAFEQVAAVFKMPKETDEQKILRKAAMQEALKEAALVPYAIMENTVKALHIHKKSIGNTNPTVISDTGVGVLCLKSALSSGWLNVKVNLDSIDDKAFVVEFTKKSKQLLEEGNKLANQILNEIKQE
jgi:formiminotetrahydrofolate cyclodeaminase